MAEKTNETRMRRETLWGNFDTDDASVSKPDLVSSGSDEASSSILSGRSKHVPSDLPYSVPQCCVDHSYHNQKALTTPRKEERDASSTDERRNPSTTTPSLTSEERFQHLFQIIGHSPPKATRDHDYEEVMKIANKLLEACGVLR